MMRLVESRMSSMAKEFRRISTVASAAKGLQAAADARAAEEDAAGGGGRGLNATEAGEQAAALKAAAEELAAKEEAMQDLLMSHEVMKWSLGKEMAGLEGSDDDAAEAEAEARRRQVARQVAAAEKSAYDNGMADGRAQGAKELRVAKVHAAAARRSQDRLKILVRDLADQVIALQSEVRRSASATESLLEREAAAAAAEGGRLHRTMAFINEEADSWGGEITDEDDARVKALQERVAALQGENLTMSGELDELRSAVHAAGRVHGGVVEDLPAMELRDLVRKQRHDAELLRLRSALEAREGLAVFLREIGAVFTKEVRWTSDRLVRHTEAYDHKLIESLHFEVDGLRRAVHKALVHASRALRGRILPVSPAPPTQTKRGGTVRKDQLRWLQGCCGVLFPHCLVCIFDPSKQDDTETNPWTLLESGAYNTLESALDADGEAETENTAALAQAVAEQQAAAAQAAAHVLKPRTQQQQQQLRLVGKSPKPR